MIWLAVATAAVGAALALWALYGLGRRVPVGDESNYLSAAGQRDPYTPDYFLRVPLLSWLAARCHGVERLPVRLVLAMLSVLTVLLAALAGFCVGGVWVGALAAGLLLLHPERILLSCHVWPDGLVALAVTLVTLLLVAPLPSGVLLWLSLGGACVLGTLARIDFLVVLPTVWLCLWASGRADGASTVLLLFTPTAIALLAWTLRNRYRYGLLLPDNTWIFNLMVTEAEVERSSRSDFALAPLVSETWLRWCRAPETRRGRGVGVSLASLCARPGRFFLGVVRRCLGLCGPDTFLRENLLPRDGAYPELSERGRRCLDMALRASFPLLMCVAVLGAVLRHQALPVYAWPALSLWGVAALFFARTRFRVAQLPVLSLLAAEGLVELPRALRPVDVEQVGLLLSLGVLFWALVRIRASRELPA